MEYTTGQVRAWFVRCFAKAVLQGNEVVMPCPRCQHPAFYFNTKKRIGFCHRANCHWKPHLRDLIELKGVAPGSEYAVHYEEEPEALPVQVELPAGCVPLVYKEEGRLLSDYPEVVKRVKEDRYILPHDQWKWQLQFETDRDRVVIPIYYQGVLRNYISRSVWWCDGRSSYMRYDYPRGTNIKDWLFGWDVAKEWEQLTLVENTFNGIWLFETLHCTSNFGSHLSDAQIELICSSKVKEVHFMWDYGAEVNRAKCMKKLMKRGIRCKSIDFSPDMQQPDDYDLDDLLQKQITMVAS
jgi:hypothetical protein